jgi:hypothetical protein
MKRRGVFGLLFGFMGASAVGPLSSAEQIREGYGLVALSPGAKLKCASALAYLEAIAAHDAEETDRIMLGESRKARWQG